jgi:hypothetical protein
MAGNINKPLNIDSASAHDNGFVGYVSDKIYRNIPGEDDVFGAGGIYSKNGDRSKDLFAHDDADNSFQSLTASSIANRLHLNKSELEISGDGHQGRINDLEGPNGEISTQETIISNSLVNEDIQNAAALLVKLNAELTLLKQGENFLLDSTTELIEGVEPGQNDAYNPDFPAESISYMYRRQDFLASERGEATDGISSGNKAPNVAYPSKLTNDVSMPYHGSGGFGSSESSLNQAQISSLNIVKKYI